MLESLKSYFQNRIAPAGEDDAEQRLRTATCVLLLEAAHADTDFAPAELQTIVTLVSRRFGLDPDAAGEALQVAEAARRQSGDLYQFARLVNDSFTRERKHAVLELMWQVVFSDGVLEAHEDALMHKMGTLLGIRHEELIALKLQVKRGLDL